MARARLVGPSAAMFHSSASRSVIETNVGSPPIVRRTSPADEIGVDRASAREDRLPLRVGVGLGDARRFDDPLHRHLVEELDLAWLDTAGDRRGARWLGRAGQRNVSFAGEQS